MEPRRLKFTAAAVALGLGLVLALTDRRGPLPGTPPSDGAVAPAWAHEVEAGRDHVDLDTFARWFATERHTLLVVDVRPADEYAAFHLPGAVNVDLVRLLGPEGADLLAAHANRRVVLVSNGMTHPGQAWVELVRRGHRNVTVLEEGLDGLKRQWLTPPSLRGATTARRVGEETPAFRAWLAALLGRDVVTGPAGAWRYATDPATLAEPTVVSTAWVEARLGRVVVLDTREKAEDVAKGRIPGAVHVPIAATRETRGGVADEMLPPEALAAKAGGWGLAPDDEVVLYGGDRLQDPTHLALALEAMGHRRLAVMEGGYGAWVAERRPTATDAPSPAPKSYVARPGAFPFGVELDAVAEASRTRSVPILDVRPTKAFEGEQGNEARGGRIPGSVSRPYTDDVVVADGAAYWRDPATLRAAYAALGLALERPVIVSCRTGHQASQGWFTLRHLLGYHDARWFDGSWKAWALRADLPAETGPATPGRDVP